LLSHRRLTSFCCALALLAGFAAPVLAGQPDDEATVLQLLGDEQLPPATARFPRPISHIAENVTVITAEQIALLNAHSLAEVLQTVPGIYVQDTRTPGNFTFFNVQGEDDGRGNILLLIDGVSQGNLLQGTSDPGLIPVQHIERVEIIKGSASAAWGPALGGVVNIVTKIPEGQQLYGGTASASYGERNTADLLADISGSSHGVGYYLFGGNLHSDGLLPNNGTNRNNLYGKLTYDLPVKGSLTIGGSYTEANRGLEEAFAFDFNPPFTEHDNSRDRRYYSFINFSYPLRPDLTLELSGYDSTLNNRTTWGHLDSGAVIADAQSVLEERNSSAKAKLIWGDSQFNLTTGIEYLHSEITQFDLLNPASPFATDRTRDSLSFYANGAITFERLTLLPGIRYDKTGLDDNTLNYTLGATYRLSDKTLLRGYGAKGYAMPSAVAQSVPAQIWTFQAGIESEAVPYLWLKGTWFYNHIWDIQSFQANGFIYRKYDRQGFELEAKTAPVLGLSLSSGYTFTDTRDADSHDRIKGVPTHLVKVALNYSDNSRGTQGVFTGNYARLNMDDWALAHDSPMIWNLHLTQKLLPARELSPEIFFNVNNIFNGSQYWFYWFKNAPRWTEFGVRFKF